MNEGNWKDNTEQAKNHNREERRFDENNTISDIGISDGMPTAMTALLAPTMTEISSA